MEQKTYDLDNFPKDAEVNTSQSANYAPIDPTEMYQVEITKITMRDNALYNPDKDSSDNKYKLSFEFAILNDGEYYGRRLWQDTSLAMKPARDKYQATALYKIVGAALDSVFTWDACASFAGDLARNLKETVLGKQIKVAIENVTNPETKKVKSKIKTFYPVKKQLPKFDAEKSKAMGEAKKAEATKPEAAQPTPDPLGDQGLNFDQVMNDIDKK